jgi:phytoene desaturase
LHIIVIGSGIGGLSGAIRLRLLGHEVEVFEANEFPGGKLSEFREGGFRFDAGPSLFTMPQKVDELFELAGLNPRDYFNYNRLEVNCRYFDADGTRLTVFADSGRLAEELRRLPGVNPDEVFRYLEKSRDTYEKVGTIFTEQSLRSTSTWLSKKVLRALSGIPGYGLFSSLNGFNRKRLSHPLLIKIFNRYATYNGSDPYRAPAILHSIPHLEQNIGAFLPVGGMHAITESLFGLAKQVGVRFRFSERVDEITVEDKRTTGVRSPKGSFTADAVVSNMDVFHTYRKLLPAEPAPERVLKQERSSSAVIFYWGIGRTFAELDVHNIFFANDYRAEFRALFEAKAFYPDPTIYVNITSKIERADAPEGMENWFVMVNAPANDGQCSDETIAATRKAILKKLSRMLGVDLEPLIRCERVLDPRTIESRTSSYMGSLYGTSSNNAMSAFMRHRNDSITVKGLYFAGGSVHPGGGIPLALNSGKIVSQLIGQQHR